MSQKQGSILHGINNMDRTEKLLSDVKDGRISIEDAVRELRLESFEELGYAKVDLSRERRRGTTEVIYGAGKTSDQICGIAESLIEHGQKSILITRIAEECSEEVRRLLGNRGGSFSYDEISRTLIIGEKKEPDGIGRIAVVTAGTSDLPVAEEAVRTAEFLGNDIIRIYDVGVAGIHRLFANLEQLLSAQVVIVIAGMEGALASVTGGLVSVPVIAVPTSVGYGASFEGLAALLSMLNSCASGVSVVNIDNGYGAAYQASQINHMSIFDKNRSKV